MTWWQARARSTLLHPLGSSERIACCARIVVAPSNLEPTELFKKLDVWTHDLPTTYRLQFTNCNLRCAKMVVCTLDSLPSGRPGPSPPPAVQLLQRPARRQRRLHAKLGAAGTLRRILLCLLFALCLLCSVFTCLALRHRLCKRKHVALRLTAFGAVVQLCGFFAWYKKRQLSNLCNALFHPRRALQISCIGWISSATPATERCALRVSLHRGRWGAPRPACPSGPSASCLQARLPAPRIRGTSASALSSSTATFTRRRKVRPTWPAVLAALLLPGRRWRQQRRQR